MASKEFTQTTDRIARLISSGLILLFVVFLLSPVVIVILLSFSNTSFIAFPPQEWGLRQYETLVQEEKWISAIWMSLRLGILSSLLALVIGVAAVFAMKRAKVPFGSAIRFLGLSGLIIPISAYAVALYGTFSLIGFLGTLRGLVVAHALLSIPLVLIIVGAAIDRIPRDLEWAAMSLGASRLRAWLSITIPLLTPAILAAFLLGLVTSFDEAVFVSFLGGPGLETLPKAIFDSIRFGSDAVITAIATVLIVVTATLVAAATVLNKEKSG